MKTILCLLIVLSRSFADNIINSLHVSQASYCDNQLIQSWTCKTCDTNADLYNIYDIHGEKALVGRFVDTNTLFISFRGSETIENWIDDAQFSLTCPYDNTNICVETGFYKVFEYMKNDIQSAIETNVNQYNIKNILFTGHSLGAAVATLMAYHFANENLNIELVTFGSPRIGNIEFVNDFPKIVSYRITHYYDIVPHVPQQFLHYNHIPHELWYNEDNTELKDCNDMNLEEDPLCSNSCGPIHCTSTSDHLNYLNISMGSEGDC